MSRLMISLTCAAALTACSGGVSPGADESALTASLHAPALLQRAPAYAPPAPAPVRVNAPALRLSCAIVAARTPHGLRITPVVHADRRLRADYALVVIRTDAGGASDIEQSGPFEAFAGDRLSLSSAEFSLERGARYRAVLTVRKDGREICRRETRS